LADLRGGEHFSHIENNNNDGDTDHSILKDIHEINKEVNNNKKCTNSHCKYYRKKYKFYKENFESTKTKLKKEKKTTEMLNFKLFYETNKHIIGLQTDRSEKLNSTNMTTQRAEAVNETKLTKELYEKLEENLNLFEKLENEIINKNVIIEKQNETIKHQKDTIDKLINQISTFLIIGKENTDFKLHENNPKNIHTNSFDNNPQAYNDNYNKPEENSTNPLDYLPNNKDSDLTISFSLTKSHNKVKEQLRSDEDIAISNSESFIGAVDYKKPLFKSAHFSNPDHEINDILNNN